MKKNEKQIERRKHKRFSAKNGTFAVVRSNDTPLDKIKKMSMGEIACAVYKANPEKVGQIIDLSQGGLSFSYIDKRDACLELFGIDILSADNSFYLDNLSYKTVMDVETADEPSFSPIKVKRQGIKFTELTPDQLAKLKYFLQNHTDGEVAH
jgi:hypothetical protein